MKVKKGIVLYSIELDGCLNGVYTNEHEHGRIQNEIAVKIPAGNKPKKEGTEKDDPGTGDLTGTYKCTYFEKQDPYHGSLEISKAKPNASIYTFEWKDEKGKLKFRGTGYKMNEKQVAVRYESA